MYDVLEKIPGKDMEGMTYEPLFPYYADQKCGALGAFRVLCDNYVTSGDGTGIVHQVHTLLLWLSCLFGTTQQLHCYV